MSLSTERLAVLGNPIQKLQVSTSPILKLWYRCQEVELFCLMVVLVLSLWRSFILFSIEADPEEFPPIVNMDSFYPTFSPNLAISHICRRTCDSGCPVHSSGIFSPYSAMSLVWAKLLSFIYHLYISHLLFNMLHYYNDSSLLLTILISFYV